MDFVEYMDQDMLALSLARRIVSDLRRALNRRERALLVVPGGSTPGPVFDLLGGLDLDWSRVDILPTDERWVQPENPRSNARLIKGRLMTDGAASARLIPLWVDAETPEAGMARIIDTIEPLLPVDVAVIGMGSDGHVASLFPGGDRLDEALATGAPCVLPMNAPGAPEPRVTLTLPVLRNAFDVHILIIGAEKRAVIERSGGKDPSEFPVAGLLSSATVHWAP